MLAKPIKYFNEMQELFIGSNAEGYLALDYNTFMDIGDGSDSDESRELFDLNCHIARRSTRWGFRHFDNSNQAYNGLQHILQH